MTWTFPPISKYFDSQGMAESRAAHLPHILRASRQVTAAARHNAACRRVFCALYDYLNRRPIRKVPTKRGRCITKCFCFLSTYLQIMPFGHITPVRMVVCCLTVRRKIRSFSVSIFCMYLMPAKWLPEKNCYYY